MWVINEDGHTRACSPSFKKCEKYIKKEIKAKGKFVLKKEYLYDAEGHINCVSYENSTKDGWFCVYNVPDL